MQRINKAHVTMYTILMWILKMETLSELCVRKHVKLHNCICDHILSKKKHNLHRHIIVYVSRMRLYFFVWLYSSRNNKDKMTNQMHSCPLIRTGKGILWMYVHIQCVWPALYFWSRQKICRSMVAKWRSDLQNKIPNPPLYINYISIADVQARRCVFDGN